VRHSQACGSASVRPASDINAPPEVNRTGRVDQEWMACAVLRVGEICRTVTEAARLACFVSAVVAGFPVALNHHLATTQRRIGLAISARAPVAYADMPVVAAMSAARARHSAFARVVAAFRLCRRLVGLRLYPKSRPKAAS
jgi:hypothetical protein